MYKLAIFDFDGTLVDSAPGIVETMRQVVDDCQLDLGVVDAWQALIGLPIAKQMELVFPDADKAFHDDLIQRYRTVYDAKAVEICPLFPQAQSVLEVLRQEGVMLTIGSSKRSHLINRVLDHHKLTELFHLVVGANDVEHHKPHPETVALTLRKLSVKPHEVVVIGDSTYDLEMAKNAGVDAIGVTTGPHDRATLSQAKPLFVVEQLSEVVPIILNAVKHSANQLGCPGT